MLPRQIFFLGVPFGIQVGAVLTVLRQQLQLGRIPFFKLFLGIVELHQFAGRTAHHGIDPGEVGGIAECGIDGAAALLAALALGQVGHGFDQPQALLQLVGELFLFGAQFANDALVVFLGLLLPLEGVDRIQRSGCLIQLGLRSPLQRQLEQGFLLGRHTQGRRLQLQGLDLGLDGGSRLLGFLGVLVDDDSG
ncbi:hypothetical protein D9M68_847380 [compost metagenome]